MDVRAVNAPMAGSSSSVGAQSINHSQAAIQATSDTSSSAGQRSATESDLAELSAIKLHRVQKVTDAMNKFVESIDVNMQFKIHQKTNELVVQFVDKANNKVLKEFPSQDFLDTIAAIRDYVGILLDQKI